MKNQSKTKYFLYARKSTESEDRQVLSIESQIGELKKIAEREGLEVVAILSESRSAKELGRPVFASMIERISKGEASGILCWKLDRLARNFIDGGAIIQLLQTGSIQHIRTFEKSYYPQDNVLLMAVEFGMANQYSRDLAVNVKRGMRHKAEKGWYPFQPPLGYLNSKTKGKGNNDIYKDPERFDLVRKMWDLMLTGAYTPPKILEIATRDWGLRTRKDRNISRSNIYAMFSNPFYYGQFEFPRGSGEWYNGKHEQMVSIEEYDKVQALLGKKGRPRPKKHIFAFIGSMRCAQCGMGITAEVKTKMQKNGNVHNYIYYHCTKKSRVKCTEGLLEEKALVAQIFKRIDELEIPDSFHKWALKWLERENAKEITTRQKAIESQRKAYDDVVRKLDRLIDMRANDELSEGEYRERRDVALREKARLQALFNKTDKGVDDWVENMESAIEFIAYAKQKFENGTPDKRRCIFVALGSNRRLKDRLVLLDTEKTLLPLKKAAEEVRRLHEMFEPPKDVAAQDCYEQIYSNSSTLSAQLDSNQRPSP